MLAENAASHVGTCRAPSGVQHSDSRLLRMLAPGSAMRRAPTSTPWCSQEQPHASRQPLHRDGPGQHQYRAARRGVGTGRRRRSEAHGRAVRLTGPLPPIPSRFVGRAADVRQLGQLVDDHRASKAHGPRGQRQDTLGVRGGKGRDTSRQGGVASRARTPARGGVSGADCRVRSRCASDFGLRPRLRKLRRRVDGQLGVVPALIRRSEGDGSLKPPGLRRALTA